MTDLEASDKAILLAISPVRGIQRGNLARLKSAAGPKFAAIA